MYTFHDIQHWSRVDGYDATVIVFYMLTRGKKKPLPALTALHCYLASDHMIEMPPQVFNANTGELLSHHQVEISHIFPKEG